MARGVHVGYGPPALAALAAAAEAAQDSDRQDSDRLAPVTIVTPSQAAGRSVRWALGRRGCLGWRFATLDEVCEQLGARTLAESGRLPLPDVVHGEAVRAAVAASTGPLAAVARNPSSVRAVERALTRLRGVPHPELERIAADSARGAELVGLLRATRTRLRGWYDGHDLRRAAATAARVGTAARTGTAALAELGPVVLHLPRDLSAAEFDLVAALAGRGRLSAVLGACGDAEADREGVALADRLEPLLGPIARTLPGTPPTPTRRVSTPDPETEIHAALRAVIEGLEQGLPPHRVAILYTAASPYAVIAAEELAAAGIPFTTRPGTFGQTAAGRCLRELLSTAPVPGPRPPQGGNRGGAWEAAAGWAVALLERRLAAQGAPAAWPGVEAEAAQQVRAALGTLGALDELGTVPDPQTFRQSVERLLEAPLTAREDGLTGVVVGAVADGLGLDLDLLVIVGMAEGLAPPIAAGDPLPLAPGGLAPDSTHRHDFLAALAAARAQRVVTFGRSDPRGARAQTPSRWLLDALRRPRRVAVRHAGG